MGRLEKQAKSQSPRRPTFPVSSVSSPIYSVPNKLAERSHAATRAKRNGVKIESSETLDDERKKSQLASCQ